jgi:hypothetical protein
MGYVKIPDETPMGHSCALNPDSAPRDAQFFRCDECGRVWKNWRGVWWLLKDSRSLRKAKTIARAFGQYDDPNCICSAQTICLRHVEKMWYRYPRAHRRLVEAGCA